MNCKTDMVPQAANPILPLDELIPDVEARVFRNRAGEERVYLYGSHDEFGSETWCSYQYRVYSSPVTDLKNWTDHGVSFASRKGEGYIWNGEDTDGVPWSDGRLYAPDVNKIGDTYYLVTCNEGGPCLGMATSPDPEGPFCPAQKIVYDDGTETSSIDPALYVEPETNQVYLLWGQRPQFGARGLLGAELIQDENGVFRIVKKETERVLFTGEGDAFGFYEGASIRKVGEKYYLLYPSDHGKGLHMMSYAIADHPLGPYQFGGELLENDGCDLEPGNNHGSFCEINGQWYLFYHRGFGNSNMQRRVCVEKIFFHPDGHIGDQNGDLLLMTNHGFGGPLNPFQEIQASYATRVRIEGFPSGCYLTEKGKNLHPLIHIQNGNCVEYRDFDFGTSPHKKILAAQFAGRDGGRLEITVDSPGNPSIAALAIGLGNGEVYQTQESSAFDLSGIHTIYFKFYGQDGREIGDLASFTFRECSSQE